MMPGYGGGANWNGGAFDPETGMMYVPTRNQPMVARLHARRSRARRTSLRSRRDGDRARAARPADREAAVEPHHRDRHEHRRHRWSKSIGTGFGFVRKHPDLRGLKLDFDAMGQVGVRPSPLLTKTLLFLGEVGLAERRSGGKMFRAYDKATAQLSPRSSCRRRRRARR